MSEPRGLAGPDRERCVARERTLFALVLLVALLLRLSDFREPYSGLGHKSVIGCWGTACFAKNFDQHGFVDGGFMPYRWRLEFADGKKEFEYYHHHPAWYAVLTGLSVKVFGLSEEATRLPWLLFSLAAIASLWRFFRLVWGPRAALLAAFLYAIFPLTAYYGNYCWVESGAITFVYGGVLWRYVRWLRTKAGAELGWAAAWCFFGGLVEWTTFFILPGIGLHALVHCLRSGGGLRELLKTLLLPAAALLAVAVHFVHMLLIMPWERVLHETSNTVERSLELTDTAGTYLAKQLEYTGAGLTVPLLVVAGIAVLRQLVRFARGTLRGEEGLLFALLLPGPIYLWTFRFRGMTHDFLVKLSFGYFAISIALELLTWYRWLVARNARVARTLGAVVLVASAALGTRGMLAYEERFGSDDLEAFARDSWATPLLADEQTVVIMGVGPWALAYYARAPVQCRVNAPGPLQARREAQYRKMPRGTRFLFFYYFDVGESSPYYPALLANPLYAFLRRVAPSERHFEHAASEPGLAFEVFDLTDWVWAE